MENKKYPFLPVEALRTQRVEVYLNDLKDRLKQLRQQHDEVIHNSVEIIKEIDEVSSSILLPETSSEKTNGSSKRIKQLIQEFESTKLADSVNKGPICIDNKVDIQKILHNFEKLNESHVLKESLVLFKRAKESFEKIDTYLNKPSKPVTQPCGVTRPVKNLNIPGNERRTNNIDDIEDSHSLYGSCCSSVDHFLSTEDFTNVMVTNNVSKTNSLEVGYEGDNDDSEYDLQALKRKRTK